jgi:hypothetical protein
MGGWLVAGEDINFAVIADSGFQILDLGCRPN